MDFRQTFRCKSIASDDRIDDVNTLDIEILGVVGVQHAISDVRNIHAGVAFSRNVDLAVVKLEGINEVLPEAHELSCNVSLAGRCWCTLGEASANRS